MRDRFGREWRFTFAESPERGSAPGEAEAASLAALFYFTFDSDPMGATVRDHAVARDLFEMYDALTMASTALLVSETEFDIAIS